MPATVRKRGSRWAIVNANNGHTYGTPSTKRKAQVSAAIRNGHYRPGRNNRRTIRL